MFLYFFRKLEFEVLFEAYPPPHTHTPEGTKTITTGTQVKFSSGCASQKPLPFVRDGCQFPLQFHSTHNQACFLPLQELLAPLAPIEGLEKD